MQWLVPSSDAARTDYDAIIVLAGTAQATRFESSLQFDRKLNSSDMRAGCRFYSHLQPWKHASAFDGKPMADNLCLATPKGTVAG